MTDEQILEKAVEKAMKRGWKPIKLEKHQRINGVHVRWSGAVFFEIGRKYARRPKRDDKRASYVEGIIKNDVLFDHDFAKAFWKNHNLFTIRGRPPTLKAWQHHLQQLVILSDKERIEYLKQFI